MVWGVVLIRLKALAIPPNQPQKKLSTMSLQIYAFNCLACHVLAKHIQSTKENTLTSKKSKYKIIQVNQLTTVPNNKFTITTHRKLA